MKYLKHELSRAFWNKRTFFAFFLSSVCLMVGAYEPLMMGREMYDFAETIIVAETSGVSSLIAILFPLIACLPYASSYVEEKESGYTTYVLTKIKKRDYVAIKMFVNGAVGGSVIAVPSFLLLFLAVLVKGTALSEESGSVVIYYKDFYLNYPILYIVLLICNFFMCGAIFANLALGTARFVKNKYVVVVMPFLFYIFSAMVLSHISIYLNAITLFDVHQYAEQKRIGIFLYDLVLAVTGYWLFRGEVEDANY